MNPKISKRHSKYILYIFQFSFSNIFFLAELGGKQHFHNCNIRNNHLRVVLKQFCIFHTCKNIGKRLSALFLLFGVHNLGK
ncbi:hypothetical protein HNP69_002201 [Chryseobacterium koreense]|nr:hypothetical protein [Chryseobacterium koreense]